MSNNCDPCTEVTGLPEVTPCPPATNCPPRLCAPQEWSCGGWLYKEVDGCTTRSRLAGVMPDGTYTNPTVTVLNGCISSVVNGSNVLQSRPEPCSTNSGSAPTASAVTISPAPCNLLSGNSTNLFAGITLNQAGSNIQVLGCGSPTSPFTFNYTGDTGVGVLSSSNLSLTVIGANVAVNTIGANYTGCGYSIVDGQMRTWTPPITNIVAGLGVKVTTNLATCSATIEVQDTSKTINGISCSGTFFDPALGILPALATWQTMTSVITGSRLFIHAPFPLSIYNAAGLFIGSSAGGVTVVNFATPELANNYMQSFYSFSGQAAC